MRILALVSTPAGVAHRRLAAAALRRTAAMRGHEIRLEGDGDGDDPDGARFDDSDIAAADLLVIAADGPVDTLRFGDLPTHRASVAEAIRHTDRFLDAGLSLVAPAPSVRSARAVRDAPETAAADTAPPLPDAPGKRLVGITACPTGIAHTFMAAEALQKAARALGHTISIETQGSVGAKNTLSDADIAAADAVVIAAETKVDTSRFAGKPVYMTSTKQAMRDGQGVIRTALAQDAGAVPAPGDSLAAAPAARTGPYKHLMTGVSYMLPVVIAGGLAIALAFALGGVDTPARDGSLSWALTEIGANTAFQLFVAVLSGFIAYSIADRPGIAPGLVGGFLAHTLGAGFLGGIVSGFVAGYLTKFLADRIRLPSTMEGLKPVLILPFLSTISVGLLMIYVIAPPVEALNLAMNGWLLGMRGANAALLGLVLGGMMAVDVGGPVNKAAYTFGVGLLGSGILAPMAAVMAAGMTPPLGLAVAALLFRNRFDAEERKAGAPAFVLGLSFISEGAIPFAAKDPVRVIPAIVLGSAVTGALSMLAGAELRVPHGGIFAAVIPGAVTHLLAYLGAILAGTLITAGALFVLKRPIRATV